MPPAITIKQPPSCRRSTLRRSRRMVKDGTLRAHRIGHRTVRVHRDDLATAIKPLGENDLA